MKTLRILLAAVLMLSFADVSAQFPMKLPITSGMVKKNPLHASVEEINNANRDGVTRIGCTLTGAPHTSQRIDSCTLIVGGAAYGSLDIDGVDFKRYFQWEDDGRIPVEVDFPRQAVFKPEDKIVFHTVSGDFSTRLGDKAKKM